tara:strand:+ start:1160 stop:1924 length:765 start_codon:yes stop_codon:yes gene_type:complete
MTIDINKLKSTIIKKMVAPDEYNNRNEEINFILLSKYLNQLKSIDELTLLDSGCGPGKKIIKIKDRFPNFRKYIGIDNYAPSIKRCIKLNEPNIEFILGDCLDMPIESKTIDIVISNQVIEHISKYHIYINEIKRVLVKDGLLVISTPNIHCPRNTFLKLIGKKPILRWSNIHNLPLDEFKGHTQEFTEIELIDLFISNGFKLIESYPIRPMITFKGNLIFNFYSIVEFLFFKLTQPFVPKGYSKNNNMIFKKL